MKRLLILPALVLTGVVALPLVLGDHPVAWNDLRRRVVAQFPPGSGHSPPAASSGAHGQPAPVDASPVAEADRYPVKRVSARWHEGAPELGVQVYWESNTTDTDADVWGKAQRIVNYVVDLGANSVAVSFPFFTDSLTASTVHAQQATPSPQRVGILTRVAARAGLRVTLRPLLDERSLQPVKGWRGGILPDSVPTWFASYRSLLMPYLQVAARTGVSTFVIGAELNSMQKAEEWQALLAEAHAHFAGAIAYDFNFDDFLRKATFPAEAVGVDAYFAVKAPDSAPARTIAASWDRTLNRHGRGALPGVVFSEVGIGARKGAFSAPGDFTSAGRYDPRVQPTWYQGVCTVARKRRVGGIYFWKVDFDADPAQPAPRHRATLDFVGSPASEQAIRDCLSGWTGD